jgi:hypothetical protein
MTSKIKIKQLTSDNELSGKTLLSDGSNKFFFDYPQIEKGMFFPSEPINGDLFFYTIDNEPYMYDVVRVKWISLKREILILGKAIIPTNVSGYLGVSDVVHSSTTGIILPYDGVILSSTIDNSNNMGADRNIEIRINNSLVNKVVLTISSATKQTYINNINLNFNQYNFIHAIAIANNVEPELENISLIIEIGKRN